MKISKTRIIGAAAVVTVIGLAAYAMRPKPLAVDTAVTVRAPLEATVEADGRTRVRERYVVVAPVAGRLERIVPVEGRAVRAGDVVARLRPLPLDSTNTAQARARIDGAEALALSAETQARVAAAALEQRRRELSRAERLLDVGGVAPRVVEECRLALIEAEEASRSARERSRAADADVRQARAVLAGQEGDAVPVLVRSPAAGRVLRVPERSERIVAAGTPLLEIGDPSSLEVVVDVVSSDAMRVHPGDYVRFAQWGPGENGEANRRPRGRVREIEPSGYSKVSALGVEEQRVNVIVDLDEVPPLVGDGFRVEASIIVWSASSALVLPRSALIRGASAGTWTVFVVADGRASLRPVKIGHLGGTGAEVLDGLRPAETVVVFPSDKIKGGTRVTTRRS